MVEGEEVVKSRGGVERACRAVPCREVQCPSDTRDHNSHGLDPFNSCLSKLTCANRFSQLSKWSDEIDERPIHTSVRLCRSCAAHACTLGGGGEMSACKKAKDPAAFPAPEPDPDPEPEPGPGPGPAVALPAPSAYAGT